MAFSTHDIVPDSPTNNFATLNPLENPWFTHSNGNLATVRNGTSNGSWRACSSSIAVESDIWYYELLVSHGEIMAGVFSEDVNIFAANQPQDSQNSLGMVLYEGQSSSSSRIRVDSTFPSNISEWAAANTIIGFLVDFTNTTFKVYFNGTLKHTASFSSSVIVGKKNKIVIVSYSGTSNGSFYLNFGQDPTFGGAKSPSTTYTDANGIGAFYYQPPTGALALCTANLPDFTPDVAGDVPQDYFKAVTYDGDNNDNHSISTVGFQPDLIWIKTRSVTSQHVLIDSVRGDDRELFSSSALAEQNPLTTNHVPALRSIDSTGFTLSPNINPTGNTNSSDTFVAWCWKAGGAPTADNSNTSGAMTANSVSLNGTLQSNYTPAGSPTIYPKRMSINTDAGFSIVKYVGDGNNGATFSHGLNQTPDISIIKNLDSSIDNWYVGGYPNLSAFSANNKLINLNTDFGMQTAGSNALTNGSSLITIDTAGSNLGSTGVNYIAYCWHSVEGYSKFGSYTGNGSGDGPFVFCGFRPSFIIMKSTGTGDLQIYDTARNPYNVSTQTLYANGSYQEDSNATNRAVDILSNGFKIRSGLSYLNSGNFIFMAFAEQSFKYSNAR